MSLYHVTSLVYLRVYYLNSIMSLIECERNPNLGDAAKLKLEGGVYQLCNTVVIPRLKPLIDGFSSTSHNITEEEFAYYEVNDPFIQNFITNLDAVLSSFKASIHFYSRGN
ncbi:hypothetical protein QZH41_003565 [Actinostola sp. cb2023]|nr:hypothetical protein QZH41_003565 [Actinostola sp. cb2023]